MPTQFIRLVLLLTLSTVARSAESSLQWSGRLRFADIEQTNIDGYAASLKLRMNWQHLWFDDWSTELEIDGVGSAFRDQHNDGVHSNDKPFVPDPPGIELNTLNVNYRSAQWQLIVGRQRIDWDNQRFIGGNAFWQNEQTFDALTARWFWGEASQLNYAYLHNVNRIFGNDGDNSNTDSLYDNPRPSSLLGNHRMDSHLLHWLIKEWDHIEFSAYAHWIDNLSAEALSHETRGLRWRGDWKAERWRYHVELEKAVQQRREMDDEWKPYTLALATVAIAEYEWGLRHEKLGSKNDISFITPLASLHDFHGIVGKFSAPPTAGLQEQRVHFTWRMAPWLLELKHMRFFSADGEQRFGRENDLTLRYKWNRQHSVALNGGRFYHGDDNLVNETRWYLDYSFAW